MKKWIVLSCFIGLEVHAASLGTYRIYLDSEHRQEKFIVKNSNAIPEKCDVSFSYMAYDDKAGVKKLTANEQAVLSQPAISHLRFSPKKFTIEPKSFQYIAFTYRRQINDEPAEHRTYANIQCVQLDERAKKGVNLKPTIMHSVPLVIRTGKPQDLNANLNFSHVEQQQDTIYFRLSHTGNRSVYGDIKLVSEEGKELKVLQRNVVIYPEMKYKDFSFSLASAGETLSKKLKIVFQETGVYSAKKQFELPIEEVL
ncbi:hypothetical protein Patl_1305 [Paraglaciecola sp. T6c]|uniref:hypothetical protein n=1 Tax=Pseudoalteromonas atlantica (strain T6c / ATCC BAA-1087) TaxID=3042615 RepID=UPI00005C655E|nr:hypothetical protein [Paraglaciecola sp. T6c]ABG39831.1 hypothetical protein Patl_1305 [Paraglaciecola sp. T6c]